jgi:hypothetical protein
VVHAPGDTFTMHNSFGPFPPSLIHYINSKSAFSAGSSTVPQWDSESGLSFVHRYVRMKSQETKSEGDDVVPMYPLLDQEIYSKSCAAWTGAIFDVGYKKIPMILVFGELSVSDIFQIEAHYRSLKRRNRLLACPEWFYLDLLSSSSHWRNIWGLAVDELGERSTEVNRGHWSGSILQRMRRLNRAMATNLMLRESLHIESNSIKEVCERAADTYASFQGLGKDGFQVAFISRCQQARKSIEHDLLVAQGILEQLQNLMAMVVSLEQISQGEAVGRLGVLAFIFIPISWVAVRLLYTSNLLFCIY